MAETQAFDFGGELSKLAADIQKMPTGPSAEETAAANKAIAANDKAASTIEQNIELQKPLIAGLMSARPPEPPKIDAPKPPPKAPEPTDTLQAFGSLGSVLGLLGGLLTKRPITTALNASAEAMKGIRLRDKEMFERNFKEWEMQSQYAADLGRWQQQQYSMAMDRYKGDLDRTGAAMRAIAAANGDQQMLAALRSGNFELVHKLQADRSQLLDKYISARENLLKTAEQHDYHKQMAARPGGRSGAQEAAFNDYVKRLEAANDGQPLTPERFLEARREFDNKYQADLLRHQDRQSDLDRKATEAGEKARHNAAMEILKNDQNLTAQERERAQSAERERHNKAMEALGEKKDETANRKIDVDAEVKRDAQSTKLALEGLKQTGLNERQTNDLKAKSDRLNTTLAHQDFNTERKLEAQQHLKEFELSIKAMQEASKDERQKAALASALERVRAQVEGREKMAQAKAANPAMTGNQQDFIRRRIDTFDQSLEKIRAAKEVLKRYGMAAGLPGMVRRGGERIENVFGSNQTDRVQFGRDIDWVRAQAPRLILDAHGRPLKGEADHINNIVAGLSMGDTTANTVRALDELERMYSISRIDHVARLQGTWKPDGSHRDPQQRSLGEGIPSPTDPGATQSDGGDFTPPELRGR